MPVGIFVSGDFVGFDVLWLGSFVVFDGSLVGEPVGDLIGIELGVMDGDSIGIPVGDIVKHFGCVGDRVNLLVGDCDGFSGELVGWSVAGCVVGS